MEDLVSVTGASRHAIYSEFSGKNGLFLACLDAYPDSVVTPAFAAVERDTATMDEIRAYFRNQIAAAQKLGMPGPGCLMANAMTETAPRWRAARTRVTRHNARLDAGFAHALANECKQRGSKLPDAAIHDLATALTVFAQGLWSFSRTTRDAKDVQARADTHLSLISARMQP